MLSQNQGRDLLVQSLRKKYLKPGKPQFPGRPRLTQTTASESGKSGETTAGIDEQLIMEKTGHHSLEGVRSYKRTNSEQQENLSDILSLNKKPHMESVPLQQKSAPSSFTGPGEIENQNFNSAYGSLAALPVHPVTFPPSQVQNLNSQQMTLKPENLKNMFTFNNCSDVNIHVHF